MASMHEELREQVITGGRNLGGEKLQHRQMLHAEGLAKDTLGASRCEAVGEARADGGLVHCQPPIEGGDI